MERIVLAQKVRPLPEVVEKEAKRMGREFADLLSATPKENRLSVEFAFAQAAIATLNEIEGQASSYLNEIKKEEPEPGRTDAYWYW